MLSARNRMRRSAEFDETVKHGLRAVQPDLVVHVRHAENEDGPRVGLVVGKRVGSAVERHRVSRRLRHIARTMIDDLDPGDQIVIRALPSSRNVSSVWLAQQLRTGLRRASNGAGRPR